MNETVRVEDGRIDNNIKDNFNPMRDKIIPHGDRIKEYSNKKPLYMTLAPDFFEKYDDFERALYLLKIYRIISDDFKNMKPHLNQMGAFNNI